MHAAEVVREGEKWFANVWVSGLVKADGVFVHMSVRTISSVSLFIQESNLFLGSLLSDLHRFGIPICSRTRSKEATTMSLHRAAGI
jgi:hypothetical protein